MKLFVLAIVSLCLLASNATAANLTATNVTQVELITLKLTKIYANETFALITVANESSGLGLKVATNGTYNNETKKYTVRKTAEITTNNIPSKSEIVHIIKESLSYGRFDFICSTYIWKTPGGSEIRREVVTIKTENNARQQNISIKQSNLKADWIKLPDA